MRLLHTTKLELCEFRSREVPDYAILSHTWGDQEITIQDVKTNKGKRLRGHEKVSKACGVARADGFEWIWIDTCCIDKTSSAELSEAINSMYRWYQEAQECYAFLADVPHESVYRMTAVTGTQFRQSRWFTRGWTLQELIAPASVIFLDGEWKEIGTKSNLHQAISETTGIPASFLLGDELRHASVAQRMSWASKRETTRTEDLAYCLMGLFGIYMPMLYGEGERAFIRLQEEIMRVSDDHSLFAWKSTEDHGGILATSPAAFANSGNIIPVSPAYATSSPSTLSSRGIHLSVRIVKSGKHGRGLAILHCTEIGKERMRVAIHLRDVFLTNEDFVREQSTILGLIDMEDINPSHDLLTSLFVRQWHPTRNRNWEDTEKCVVKLADVDAQEVTSRIANFDSNCDISDGLIVIDMKTISHGLVGRLVIMCKDGNIFHILLSRNGRFLSANIFTSTTEIQLIQDLNLLEKEQSDQDRIVKLLRGGQHVHIAIKKRVLLLHGERCLTGVVEVSYSSTHRGVWFENIAILEKATKERNLLSYAAKRGLRAIFELLVDREGIESKSKDDLRTPLSWAAEGGQGEVVAQLLHKGATLESKDKYGRTPLSWAAGSGHDTVVSLLLAVATALEKTENNIEDQKLFARPRLHWRLPDHGTEFGSARNTDRPRRSPFRSVMSEDKYERTPLWYAAQNGHVAVIKLLLEKGANVNTADESGWTPLHKASGNGHVKVVRQLLKKGANINAITQTRWTSLHQASNKGHVKVVSLLLDRGADIHAADHHGWTPLHEASENGNIETVRLLLNKASNVNTADQHGWTPLHQASQNGHIEVVKLLLENGADVEVANKHGWMPLHQAAENGHLEIVSLLLESGADVNSTNRFGWTPLYVASENRHVEILRLLFDKNADANATDRLGLTPLYWASEYGHVEVVNLLLEKGALHSGAGD